jgi:hypothetical protein
LVRRETGEVVGGVDRSCIGSYTGPV